MTPAEYTRRQRSERARLAALAQASRRFEAMAAGLRRLALRDAAARYDERARTAAAAILETRRELAALRPRTCGARCRDGHACNAPANGRGGRCRRHGGASTGARTPEGRARALAALQRAREARRAA